MSDKLASIIVLNWNRLEYSKTTINNIIEKTTIPHVLVLVDNNSTEDSGVREYLRSINKSNTNAVDVIHVENPKNYGVAGGRNSGIYAVEQSEYQQDYIITVDDDVLVPDKWDVLMAQACDKIPKLGITGVNVEPREFPVREINGVCVRPKQGNLGGAILCLSRRAFLRVGYFCTFGQYSHEDSEMYFRLAQLGLMSAYIVPRGVHLDVDADKAYREEKNKAHKKGSPQLKALSKRLQWIRAGNDVYVPYIPYDPDKDDPSLTTFTNDLIMKDRK